jgi:epoxyqueuosine reductase
VEEDLKERLTAWLRGKVDTFGFAPVERFGEAPEEHHPSRICKDAETVIVYAKTIPKALLSSPSYSLYLLHRCYHTVYPYLDEVGLELANYIESNGYPAVPVPSYLPLVFHGLEPWGIVSLKHSAVLAGLGSFGRNDTVHHPDFGSMLRFGAVVTAAAMPGDHLLEYDPCPPGCNTCREACPIEAWREGAFQKMNCTAHTVKHAIYRLTLGDDYGRDNIEMIINTAGYNYWIACDDCQAVCPNNR